MTQDKPNSSAIGMEEMVQELYDRQKIRDLLMRYCRAVDRMDHDLLISCYHPDGIDDHGFIVDGPEAFWVWARDYHLAAFASHQHIVTNHSCELDGDTAHCETYWMFAAIGSQDAKLSIGGGRYIDRIEKRDGEWRIAVRKCVPDWGGAPSEGNLSPEARAILASSGIAARDETDASYERPLTINPDRIGIVHQIG